MLLQKKLFGTPDGLKEFLDEVQESVFGVFNKVMWGNIKQQSLFQLQSFVQETYQAFPPHLLTKQMSLFLGSVVTPCLRVNVSQVNENLAPVAAQFVQALANRRLSDPWLW